MVRQYYEQGAHVLLVDTGNSYQGLCELIKGKTKAADGVYFTYTEDNPIAFNPTHELLEKALEQGWKVVVERKNTSYEIIKDEKSGHHILEKTNQQ